MPVFTDALISDTTHLSTEEFGAYLLILFATWRNNGRPLVDDDVRLARVCRVTSSRWTTRLRPALVPLFDLSNATWRQKRLENEFKKVEFRVLQKKQAANSRWLKTKETSSADASDPHMQSISISKKKDSVASATGADAPSNDPVKELFDRGLKILGMAQRGLLGKFRKRHGDVVVLEAICACEREHPSDPAAYFVRCCETHAVTAKRSPSTTLWEGAYNAALKWDQEHPDCRDGGEPAEPLLGRRGTAAVP
jgi:uncharacterized protein YdaU (DUF1376 family)